jgi:predicted branched-subunit amino acid permease
MLSYIYVFYLREYNIKKSLTFKEGLKAGIPIAVDYLPILITLGLMTKVAGIPSYVGY